VRRVSGGELDRVSRGGVHQGVVAQIEDAARYAIADLVAASRGAPLIVVLDGIEDPHNVGAILAAWMRRARAASSASRGMRRRSTAPPRRRRPARCRT
jgi:23S rRNA (guanosine2251-2'-O)-methyltransferase